MEPPSAAEEPDVVSVVIHGARGLQSRKKSEKHRFKFSVILGVGHNKFRTEVVEDLFGSPVWNTEADIRIDDVSKPLTLVVTEKDDVLGQVQLPLKDLPSAKPYQHRKFPLQSHKKCSEPHGELMLSAWISATRWPKSDKLSPGGAKNPMKQLKKVKEKLSHSPIMNRKNSGRKIGGSPGPMRSSRSLSLHDVASRRKSTGMTLSVAPSESVESLSSNESGETGGAKFYSSLLDLREDLNKPEVSGISPREGPVEGGTRLTIRGMNLGTSKEDIICLYVCGVDCLSTVEYESPSKLFVTTKPAHRAGPGEIIVDTKSGGKGVSMIQFNFLGKSAPPSPFLNVSGSNESSPVLGKPPLPSPRLKRHSKKSSDTSMLSVGSLAMSTHSEESMDDLKPEVSGISPKEGPAEGGTRLTIRGQHLGKEKSDILALSICGRDCLESLEYESPRKIYCTTRAWKPGSGDVLVETESGGKGSSSVQFSYTMNDSTSFVHSGREEVRPVSLSRNPSGSSQRSEKSKRSSIFYDSDDDMKPEVTGISPREGPASGGTRLTIRGINLGQSRDDIIMLTVCGVDCLPTLEYGSSIKIHCITRSAAPGMGDIIIKTLSAGTGSCLVQYKMVDVPLDALLVPSPSAATSRRNSPAGLLREGKTTDTPPPDRTSSPPSFHADRDPPMKPPRRSIKSESVMMPGVESQASKERTVEEENPEVIEVTPPSPSVEEDTTPRIQDVGDFTAYIEHDETEKHETDISAAFENISLGGAVPYSTEQYRAIPYQVESSTETKKVDTEEASPQTTTQQDTDRRPQPVGQEKQASPGKERKRPAPPPPTVATKGSHPADLHSPHSEKEALGDKSSSSFYATKQPVEVTAAVVIKSNDKQDKAQHRALPDPYIQPHRRALPEVNSKQQQKLVEEVQRLRIENSQLQEQNRAMKEYMDHILTEVMVRCPDILCVDGVMRPDPRF